MNYSVNPSAFKSIFAVPTDIVDKHIRLANEHQLKVLLWILRNSPDNPDIDKMCAALEMNKSDAYDYLQYWVLTGVLSSEGAEDNQTSFTLPPDPEPVKAEKAITKIPETSELAPSKPSSSEIAKRIEESPEIGHLFNEAQQKLGKTIGYDGQCTLLLLYDHYGVPTEVLFMLIDYCVSIGKTNYGYIESVGKDWGKKEIDTIDKAAEQIKKLRNANSLWRELASSAGISTPRPTVKQSEYLRFWSNDLKFGIDMIILAYEEMANYTGKLSFSYMDKILKNWSAKGFRTAADVEKALTEQKEKNPSSSTGKNQGSASYDLDEFKERSLHGELKYERKKKQ